jgi:DNA-binding MarR family transcriptional regulator
MTAKTPQIPVRDYRALAEVRYVVRRFLNFSEASARAANVEPQQHQLLLALKGLPEGWRPTIGAVADRLQLHHNSAVELAQRSIERGLVERLSSETDRREVLLRITPRGERLLRRLSLAHRTELRSAGPVLARALDALVDGNRAPRMIASKKKARGTKVDRKQARTQ